MKKGSELGQVFKNLQIYHQNLPKRDLSLHSHDDFHLFIPLRDTMTLEFEDHKTTFSEGKMLYLPANISHAFSSSTEVGDRLIIKFVPPSKSKWPKQDILLPTNQFIKELLFLLLNSEYCDSHKKLIKVFFEILKKIIQKPETRQYIQSAEPRIKKFIAELESDPSVKLIQLAKRSGLSSRNLSRLCNQELSMSPKSVQTHFRIEKAKELLSGKRTVTETCFEVGYNSLSTFIENFTQLTGKLPSDWS